MIVALHKAMQEEKLRKGPWIEEEDEKLATYVKLLGERKWDSIAQASGLKRSGKSCRMRWLNYLRPSIKRGHISSEEEEIIIQLQKQLGNRWSKIARKLPGRTDNEIKNYWRTYLRKKVEANEEGDFQWSAENATQDCAYQKCANSNQEFDIADHNPVQDSKGSPEASFKFYELSTLMYPSSPFETRLFDWISELSAGAHKIEGGCCTVGSCLCFLARKNEDSGNSILNSLDSLWE